MRNVFFSFHYEDVFRVNQIRNSYRFKGSAVAGFRDASLWEEAKKKGDRAIKAMIDRALDRTTVTCVLIGQNTHQREYVEYEIQESAQRGNGLIGIRIHNIKDQNGRTDWFAGRTPSALRRAGSRVAW